MMTFKFNIQGFTDFANQNRIPLIAKEHPSELTIELWYFIKDEEKVKEFLYNYKPIGIAEILHPVSNYIEYNQNKLIEYVETVNNEKIK